MLTTKLDRRRHRSRAMHAIRALQRFARHAFNRYRAPRAVSSEMYRFVAPVPKLERIVAHVQALYPELRFEVRPDHYFQCQIVDVRFAFHDRQEFLDGRLVHIPGQSWAASESFAQFTLEEIPEDYLIRAVKRMASDVDMAVREYVAKARAA